MMGEIKMQGQWKQDALAGYLRALQGKEGTATFSVTKSSSLESKECALDFDKAQGRVILAMSRHLRAGSRQH